MKKIFTYDKTIMNKDERLKEQKKYGFLYEDDYDYLQHIAPSQDDQNSYFFYASEIENNTLTDYENGLKTTIVEIGSDSDL
ncbi:hypothetical protein HZS_969, partial [Henneguya salminicola]